jgi:hypothetical protein
MVDGRRRGGQATVPDAGQRGAVGAIAFATPGPTGLGRMGWLAFASDLPYPKQANVRGDGDGSAQRRMLLRCC